MSIIRIKFITYIQLITSAALYYFVNNEEGFILMKLLIKQRVFSWTDTYDVYDENGNPKYFVKNELFSFLHKIHVKDLNNVSA